MLGRLLNLWASVSIYHSDAHKVDSEINSLFHEKDRPEN